MHLFDGLRLKGVVYYEDAFLDLSYQGITCIKGHNKNALRATHRTNASGKSLLVSAVPSVAFNSNPILSHLGKRTSGSKGSMLTSKDSSITLMNRRMEGSKLVSYEIMKYRKGASIQYKISRNGKDLEIRTPTLAEQWISEFFPYDEESFYTHTYLDSGRPYTLKVGSAPQRAQLFTSLFHLDGYDEVKEHCAAARKELADEEIRLSEIKRRRSEIQSDIEGIDYKALRKEFRALRLERKSVKKEATKLYDKQSDLKLLSAHADTLKTLESLSDDLSETSLTKLVSKLEKKVKDLESEREAIRKYESYKESLEDWKKERKTLLKSAGEDSRSIEDLDKIIESTSSLEKKLSRRIEDLKADTLRFTRELDTLGEGTTKEQMSRIIKLMKKRGHKILGGLISELKTSVQGLETKYSTSLKLVKMAGKLTNGKRCFVCSSKVEHEHGADVVQGLKSHVSRYKNQLRKTSKTLEIVQDYEERLDIDLRRDTLSKIVQDLQDKSSVVNRKYKKLPDLKALRSILEVKRDLAKLKKPVWSGEVPTGDYDKLRGSIKKLSANVASITSYLPLADKLEALRVEFKGKDVKKLAGKIDEEYSKYQSRLNTIVASVSRIQPELKLYRKSVKQLAKVEEEVLEKEKALRDMPVLSMLETLYSAKGLKTIRMQEYASQVQDSMNRNADLIFHEPMKFDFDVGPSKFDIFATRGSGKKSKTGEVRSLSGAESKAFAMLVLLSLWKLLPSRERSNILILDEMDQGLDEEGRQLFIDTFLPELNKLVPHIIVVTPLNDEYPGSRTLIATKQGDRTRLIPQQGHHD